MKHRRKQAPKGSMSDKNDNRCSNEDNSGLEEPATDCDAMAERSRPRSDGSNNDNDEDALNGSSARGNGRKEANAATKSPGPVAARPDVVFSKAAKADSKIFKNEATGEYTCPLCQHVCESQHAFTVHIREHNPNDHSHTCSICHKTLSSASSLDRHALTHSNERPFKCRICNMAFTTNGNMHRHMRTHSAAEASLIEKDSDPNSRLGKAKKRKTAAAPSAELKSPTQESSAPKMRRCDDGKASPHHARTSSAAASRLSAAEKHRNFDAVSPKFASLAPNGIGIGFSDLTFTDFSSNKFSLIAKSFCENNVRKSSSAYHDYHCGSCRRAFPSAAALSIHDCSSSTYCNVCHCDVGSAAALLSHQVKHRLDGSIPFEALALDKRQQLNGKALPDKQDFMAMLQLHTSDLEQHQAIDGDKLTKEHDFENPAYFVHAKPLSPSKGSAATAAAAARQAAAQRCVPSEGDQSKQADLADIQSIISVTSAGNHLRSIRSSPPAASPASPLDLEGDYQSAGRPSKPSSSAAVNASELSDGEKKPTTEGETALFKCGVCPLSFKSFNALKRHNRGHTQGGHSYSCHLCPYTSLDKSTLVRHLRTHNGERPFQCKICSYAFTTKANCERHVRKRHKKVNKNEIRAAMQYNPEMNTGRLTVNNMTNNYEFAEETGSNTADLLNSNETVCKFCNVDFKFNSVLRHHLRSAHNSSNRKPFCCVVCKLGFSTRNNCYRHIQKQHPDVPDKIGAILLNGVALSAQSGSEFSDPESLAQDVGFSSIPDAFGFLQSRSSSRQSDTPSGFESHFAAQKPLQNLSLVALAQVTGDTVGAAQPLNLSAKAGPDEDQPFDLSKATTNTTPAHKSSNGHEQPLDLAVHALDLSVKPRSSKLSPFDVKAVLNDMQLQSAANTLLALQSVARHPLAFPAMARGAAFPTNLQLSPPPLAISSVPRESSGSDTSTSFAFDGKTQALFGRHDRSFSCPHCTAGFTLKSNMERHIKRKHPAFAKPSRSRSAGLPPNAGNSQTNTSSPSPQPLLSKSGSAMLSNSTRAALREVLNTKALGYQQSGPFGSNKDSRPNSPSAASQSSDTTAELHITDEGIDTQQEDEEAGDLASVSSLIDNTAYSATTLKKYFSRDERETNNNEGEEKSGSIAKKRSAYTDSPNSVSCPFCSRKFPWSSSLRRHLLTHSGEKPYKCPKCPILFSTKSNCERHLVRKHGNSQRAPTNLAQSGHDGAKQIKCNLCFSFFSTQSNLRKHFYLRHRTAGRTAGLKQRFSAAVSKTISANATHSVPSSSPNTQQRFKCHICETKQATFTDRAQCLSHLKLAHPEEYQLLAGAASRDAPVPLDSAEPQPPEKFSCLFCPRSFSKDNDQSFQRHMRVHQGTRTLKNPMMRHRVTHSESAGSKASASLAAGSKNSSAQYSAGREPVADEEELSDGGGDLIQNLLGIRDSKILDEMLDSADSAARLLGVRDALDTKN